MTRSPVTRRASTIGLDSSTRRFTPLTMRSIVCRSCSSLANTTSARSSRPARSTKTSFGPFTMISVTVSSASSGSSTPRPKTSSMIRPESVSRSRIVSTGPERDRRSDICRCRRKRRCSGVSRASSAKSRSFRSIRFHLAVSSKPWPRSPSSPFCRSSRRLTAEPLSPGTRRIGARPGSHSTKRRRAGALPRSPASRRPPARRR